MALALAATSLPNGADIFVLFSLKLDAAQLEAGLEWFRGLEACVRQAGGKVQLRTDSTKTWHFVDGLDHWKAPSHLVAACFDMNAILLAGFSSPVDVEAFWHSNKMFALLKARGPIEKIGAHAFHGLKEAFDVQNINSISFAERFLVLELIKMEAFQPINHYTDLYHRYARRSPWEIGIDCNLLFADLVTTKLMNDFTIDAGCCTAWRMRQDTNLWVDGEVYRTRLSPMRRSYSASVVVVVPILQDSAVVPRPLGLTGRRPYKTAEKLALTPCPNQSLHSGNEAEVTKAITMA